MEQLLSKRFVLFNERKLRLLRTVDMFDELIRFLRMFLRVCGSDVLRPDFRWNFLTWLCLWVMVTFNVTLSYTVLHHWGDWYAVMDTLSVSGIAFQGMIKMHSGLSRVQYFQDKHRNVRAMHEKGSRHPENNYVLLKCVLIILYIFRFFSVAYAVAGLALYIVPLYLLLAKNEKLLVIGIEIPFVDVDTPTGYVITMFYQTVMVVLAIAGILAADMAIMIIVLHIFGIVDVFKNTLKELDQLLEDPDCEEDEIHEKVLEICLMHKEIINYEENLDNHYYYTVFVQVITSVTCLSLTLFVIYMKKDWSRAMFLLATFFQLLEFCLLGTALTLKNDQIIEAIYDTKWYLLDGPDKRSLQIVLHRSQNAVEMTIGGLALLNMETFVEIIKTIYSYFTMLMSFLE